MQDIKIVIGGNFGDEGKGLMTDYFAAEAFSAGRRTLVICSNGGAQRGHTVTTPDGRRHVFHHFGSGTLAGADTWLPRFFIVNPMLFMNEYEELMGKSGVRIFLDPECPVSTPYDMITNQILEEHRGAGRHGSCGVGIWETLVREGPLLGEMYRMSDDELKTYLTGPCREQLRRRISRAGMKEIPERWKDIVDNDGLADNYICDFRLMCSLAVFAGVEVMSRYDRLIFEAGQGLLLDRCRKEFGCHTTPSNTGLRNPAELIREYLHDTKGPDVEVCYVTRTYLTRHGAGPFPEECGKEEINPGMRDLTNVPNPHQGTMRYGRLDQESFIRRIREDFDSERFPQCVKKRLTVAVTHVNEFAHEMTNRADYISNGETRESIDQSDRNAALLTA